MKSQLGKRQYQCQCKEGRVLQEETSKDKDGDQPGAFCVLGIAPRAPVIGREGGGRRWEAHGAVHQLRGTSFCRVRSSRGREWPERERHDPRSPGREWVGLNFQHGPRIWFKRAISELNFYLISIKRIAVTFVIRLNLTKFWIEEQKLEKKVQEHCPRWRGAMDELGGGDTGQ